MYLFYGVIDKETYISLNIDVDNYVCIDKFLLSIDVIIFLIPLQIYPMFAVPSVVEIYLTSNLAENVT